MVEVRSGRGRRGRRTAARNATALAALALGAFAVVAWTIAGRYVPSPIEGAPTVTGPGADHVSIVWLGDTLLGDGAQPLIDQHGMAWPGARLAPFASEDAVVANLEGAITDRTEPFDPMQRWSYNADEEAAAALAAMGVDAVSLANNHSMDRGPEGLADTILASQTAGMSTFGAGPTSHEARLPLLVESPGGVVAVLGFSDDGGTKTANSQRPGLRRLSIENVQADLRLLEGTPTTWVVAFVHWGENYAAVDSRQEAWAQVFAAAGYDMVIGTGPHVPQPLEIVDGMPVMYSLGNYIFGTPGRFQDPSQGFGLVVRTSFTDSEVEVVLDCIQTDNDVVAYQPRPCDGSQASAVLGAVNPEIVVVGDSGVVTLPLPAADVDG